MKFPKLLLFIGALLCTSISSKLWSQFNYLETSQGDNNIFSLCSEFSFQKESKVFAPSIFELYLVFDFSPFRRNQRGYLKRLQINNY